MANAPAPPDFGLPSLFNRCLPSISLPEPLLRISLPPIHPPPNPPRSTPHPHTLPLRPSSPASACRCPSRCCRPSAVPAPAPLAMGACRTRHRRPYQHMLLLHGPVLSTSWVLPPKPHMFLSRISALPTSSIPYPSLPNPSRSQHPPLLITRLHPLLIPHFPYVIPTPPLLSPCRPPF